MQTHKKAKLLNKTMEKKIAKVKGEDQLKALALWVKLCRKAFKSHTHTLATSAMFSIRTIFWK